MPADSQYYSYLLYVYIAVVGVLVVYGVHRYQLVYLYYKHRRNAPRLNACFARLPRVTVQLPMFNEPLVARRVIEHTCAIDYPRDLLEIQVLDDSTDQTVEISRQTVAEARARGVDIRLFHRDNREGFKAGALAEGLKSATSDFVLIFDADFIPPPNIIHELIHHFTDDKVGMVQARWEHLNRGQSLLTKTQAIMLDGHFVIEHTARNRSGRFMSFNGTAGMWRRACIDDAGGWQHDTLTEDLDLSYRAQMRGWKFIFLKDLTSPAELPPEMMAFKTQQARWAKGGAQTCRKLLPRILGSRLPLKIKAEAFFHLTSCMTYIWMVLLTLLLFPVLYLKMSLFRDSMLGRALFDGSLLLLATCSAGSFYYASQREVFRTWTESIKYLPFLMSLGVGVSFNNAIAVLEGLFGKASEFVRTPKFGEAAAGGTHRATGSLLKRGRWLQPFVELLFAIYLLACVILCYLNGRITIGIPFLLLFMVGYFYVAGLSLHSQYVLTARTESPAAGEAEKAVEPATARRGG